MCLMAQAVACAGGLDARRHPCRSRSCITKTETVSPGPMLWRETTAKRKQAGWNNRYLAKVPASPSHQADSAAKDGIAHFQERGDKTAVPSRAEEGKSLLVSALAGSILTVCMGGGRPMALRLTVCLLAWCVLLAAPVQGASDAFASQGYQHRPLYLRLPAPTGLTTALTQEEGALSVSWHPVTVPASLPNPYLAQLTVIAEGAGPVQVKHVRLGTTSLEFTDLALAHTGTLTLAVTAGSLVLSDLATVSFRSGVATPQLSAPFYYQEGDTARPTQGRFHYIGFNHNFANGYVATGRTNPLTPRLRIGVRHGAGYDPADADFAHFRFRLEDAQGANILGFEPATGPAGDTYRDKVLVLGETDSDDIANPGSASFATLHHTHRLPSPAPVAWQAPVTAPYWDSDWAPIIARQNGGDNLAPLSFTNLASRTAGRRLFAPVPDESYNLPEDTFSLEGAYRLRVWAEDSGGVPISPVCTVELWVQTLVEGDQLYTNVRGYDARRGGNVHGLAATQSGPGRIQNFRLLADSCQGDGIETVTIAESTAPPFSVLPPFPHSVGAGYNLSYWLKDDGSLGKLDDITGLYMGPDLAERPPPVGTFKAVDMGVYIGCAVRKSDDNIVCWGGNFSWLPLSPPAALGAVKTLAVGGYHACAIRQTDNAVLCWGYGGNGQTVAPDGEFHTVTGGRWHSCGLRSEGQVACWGSNAYGQTDVPAGLGPVRAIASGDYHNCAIRANDTVACWGRADRRQLQVPFNLGPVTVLSAGFAHTCALQESNARIVCWGDNDYGQISQVPTGGTWQDLNAGRVHTCGRRQDGTVECWRLRDTSAPAMKSLSSGQDETCGLRKADSFVQCWGDLFPIGQSGVADGRGVYPVAYKSFVNASIVHCGIRANGILDCWGGGASSILSEFPDNLGTVRAVSAYRHNACVIKTDDSLVCWGDNDDGEATVPSTLGSVKAVDIGHQHACAIKANDTLACWGLDDNGQSTVPTDLGKVESVGVGNKHTCVIKADDTVSCWGESVSLPVPSDLGTVKWLAVAQGGSYTCAIKADDSAACWGSSGFCTIDTSCQPETVPTDLAAVSAISAGPEHVCALLKADQTVTCWGDDTYGETAGPTYP